jgi:hypothetical protein
MAKLNEKSKWISNYFGNGRTIQRAYNFIINIPGSSNDSGDLQRRLEELNVAAGFPGFPGTYIREFHAKRVIIEQYNFKREIQQMGVFPKTIPVLDHKGFELEIEFEEDAHGTIGYFVQWLQKRIVDEHGFYTNPSDMYIDPIEVKITDETTDLIATYSFKQCYFLKTSKPEYNYKNNQAISYAITFGSDYYEVKYEYGSVPVVNTNQIKN